MSGDQPRTAGEATGASVEPPSSAIRADSVTRTIVSPADRTVFREATISAAAEWRGFDSLTAPNTGSAREARLPAAAGPLQPGEAFGSRYHIISIVRTGGMGAVYKAWDEELAVVVALKVIRPEMMTAPEAARAFEKRFKQELLLARQVTHRNVVRIHDLGDVGGVKYMTMPFVEGEDVAAILEREGRLPVSRVMRMARSIVSGLEAAHHAGIVHRDLKPANIMIDTEGEAVIMDFGIAATAAHAPAAAVAPGLSAAGTTMAGSVMGTIEYMAPEQALAQPVDHRGDIYAFGLILYDMLLGKVRVERAGGALAELSSRMHVPPPMLSEFDRAVPQALESVVARCVEVDPAARFQTTAELAAALDRLDDNGRPRPFERKLTRTTIAAAAVLFAAFVTLAWWASPGRAPARQPDPVSVLIADFDNAAGDAAFRDSLEPALAMALEGAPFITAYDRRDARRVAARIAPGSALDSSTARLIAIREGIKVVVGGRIEAGRDGYRITIAGESADGTPLWRHQAAARDSADVLRAITTLAADVRRALGDTASRSQQLADTESLTAGSLEAVQNYSLGQDLHSSGRFEEAIARYRKAVAIDPNFGRAYAGWATSADHLGRKNETVEVWKKALALVDRMTEREKYRTLGTYYLAVAKNYDKAIENYATLVRLYPTDQSGHNNLGYAYFMVLNFGQALEEGRRAVEIYPKNVLFRNNYALYAMYAGDFATAEKEARTLVEQAPDFYKNHIPLAVAALARNDFEAADRAYELMARTGAPGASLAAMGRADMAMYRGRQADAERILRAGIAADEQAGNLAALSAKWVALAETYMATGRVPLALTAISEAVKSGTGEAVFVPAARLYLQAGKVTDAMAMAAKLDNLLQPQPRAYSRIIDGNIALANHRRGTALDAFKDALKLADLWLARYDVAVAYVHAEHYAEALAELEACVKRRGEATAVFLDDTPSFRYMAALRYWLARAQEGLGQRSAAQANYREYVALRTESTDDPLLADARRRGGL